MNKISYLLGVEPKITARYKGYKSAVLNMMLSAVLDEVSKLPKDTPLSEVETVLAKLRG